MVLSSLKSQEFPLLKLAAKLLGREHSKTISSSLSTYKFLTQVQLTSWTLVAIYNLPSSTAKQASI